MLIGILLVAAALSAMVLTAEMRKFALKKEIVDIPNSRSSHETPTPRGGGVAIVATTVSGIALLAVLDFLEIGLALGLAGGAAAIALIGYLDDLKDVSARRRLGVQLGSSIWFVYWVSADLSSGPMLAVLLACLGALWLVWWTNLYNFMDGIDGLAALQAVYLGVTFAVIFFLSSNEDLAVASILVGSASLGFLVWNLAPAKIFMGDVGSGFLGFLFGSLSIVSLYRDSELIWPLLIVMSVFLLDATYTLLVRLVRGCNVFRAHRSHCYQNAAAQLGSHGKVVWTVLAINLLWLFPLGLAALARPSVGPGLLFLAWAPLLSLLIYFRAGFLLSSNPAVLS